MEPPGSTQGTPQFRMDRDAGASAPDGGRGERASQVLQMAELGLAGARLGPLPDPDGLSKVHSSSR